MVNEVLEKLKFPVIEEPLLLEDGSLTGLKAIYKQGETDPTEWLGYHTEDYNITTNKQIIESALPILEQAGAHVAEISKRFTFCNERRMYLGLILDEQFDVGQTNDQHNLMLILKNSYDGSLSYGVDFGTFRVICSNGAIAFVKSVSYKKKHIIEFIPEVLKHQIANALNDFPKIKETYERMNERTLSKEEVDKIFVDAEKRNLATKTDSENLQGLIGTQRNAYLMFQIITYYITHIVKSYERAHTLSAYITHRLSQKVR